jgi:hypothetical protein
MRLKLSEGRPEEDYALETARDYARSTEISFL